MPTLNWPKLIAGVLAAGALLGLAVAGVRFMREVEANKAASEAYASCRSLARDRPAAQPPCDAATTEKVLAAQRGAACEAALQPPAGEAVDWTYSALCPAIVRRLADDRNARAFDARDAAADLVRLRGSRKDDIARAEARASALAWRNANADMVIAAQPLDSGGDVYCDDECLRQLEAIAPAAFAIR